MIPQDEFKIAKPQSIPYNLGEDAKAISIDELKSYLWGAAVSLRGQIDATAYKDYIFPLVFFKRLCDVYDEEYRGYVHDDGEEFAKMMIQERPIQIPFGAHWHDVFQTTEDIGQRLKDAFMQIEHANPPRRIGNRPVGGLEGIFGDKSIWTNKTKMPDHIIRSLLNNLNKLNLSLSACPADEMGTGYEYLIGQFADDAGHTAQEFYTNRSVVDLMAEILQLQPHESIYDPTCGSGGMLIKSLTYLKEKGQEWRDVQVYGQEINTGTSAIARMNCYLHGIHDFSIINDDTLENPAFIENGRVKQFDVVLANPPYSIKNWNREKFAHDKYGRCFLGIPPQDCADYAFIQHILASLDEKHGRCAILLPHGVLFRSFESDLRTELIKADLLECIIGIGPNLFFNSPMEACIIICNRKKPTDLKKKILFINALKEITRKNGESYLEPSHIMKIAESYRNHIDVKEFCRVVDISEIETYNYDLSIQKYVFINDGQNEIKESTDFYINSWEFAAKASSESISKLNSLLS